MRTRGDHGGLTESPQEKETSGSGRQPVPEPEPVAEPEPVSVPVPEPEQQEKPDDSASEPAQPATAERRRPAAWVVVLLVAVLAGLVGLGSTSWARTILRQSFSQVPRPYTELFFTTTPGVNGAVLSVPITVNEHDDSVTSITLTVWLVDGNGKTDGSRTLKLRAKNGVATTTVTLQVPSAADLVYVKVAGKSEQLHYRFAGIAVPTATGTS